MMAFTFVQALRGSFCPTMSEHGGPRSSSGHLIGRILCAPQSLRGHTDCRPSYLWTITTTNSHRPALWLDGSSWSRPCIRHPLGQRMLPGDVVHFLNLHLSLSIDQKKCPYGANPSALCLGHQLSDRARYYRRLPTALSFLGNPQCSLPRGGVRRYKPMLQIALP